MVARDPQQKIAILENPTDRLPASRPPSVIGCQIFEGKFPGPDALLVARRASRHAFAAIVGQHLAERIRQQLHAGAAARAAEEIERKKHRLRFRQRSAVVRARRPRP